MSTRWGKPGLTQIKVQRSPLWPSVINGGARNGRRIAFWWVLKVTKAWGPFRRRRGDRNGITNRIRGRHSLESGGTLAGVASVLERQIRRTAFHRHPRRLKPPTGRAMPLRDAMKRLVSELHAALPAAFEREDYRSRREVHDAAARIGLLAIPERNRAANRSYRDRWRTYRSSERPFGIRS